MSAVVVAPNPARTMRIDAIVVLERHRKTLGDLSGLKASIAGVGLLHPIVLNSRNQLIVGQRRLEACRQLGWTEIPATVASTLDEVRSALEAERDENVCRLDMTVLEKVSLGLALEELERPEAEKRILAGKAPCGKLSQGRRDHSGDTREVVGKAVGISGTSYERVKRVMKMAEQGEPAAIEALQDLEATGKVTPAWEKATGKSTNPKGKPPKRSSLNDALKPVEKYLKDWDESRLSGTTPKESARLLGRVQSVRGRLTDVSIELEKRTVVSRALR